MAAMSLLSILESSVKSSVDLAEMHRKYVRLCVIFVIYMVIRSLKFIFLAH